MTADLIQAVRDHARRNYETGGWDILVECWEDADILAAMGDARYVTQAIRNVGNVLRTMDDYRSDIQAEAF